MTEQPTGLDRLDPMPELPPPPLPGPGAAETAVLDDLGKLPEDMRTSAVAVSALILARSLDAGEMLSRDQVGCVREIRMCMTQLREWNQAGATGDGTDETRAQVDNVRALYVAEGA
jgi:hypothetical protein